jgi:hypothetical protein
MELRFYQIDAFTDTLFKGNPACVVPLERWLPDALLLKIAQENAVPETAFFVEEEASFHLRWFTPDIEMDLCGQVHKFGNLTLTGYNSKLSNMSFDRKKNRVQDGKNIGYMNGLWLNKILKEKDSWTANDIEKRTELIVDKAIKLFSFEH